MIVIFVMVINEYYPALYLSLLPGARKLKKEVIFFYLR
jgi:hypothetical protein